MAIEYTQVISKKQKAIKYTQIKGQKIEGYSIHTINWQKKYKVFESLQEMGNEQKTIEQTQGINKNKRIQTRNIWKR